MSPRCRPVGGLEVHCNAELALGRTRGVVFVDRRRESMSLGQPASIGVGACRSTV
jgi:hypothetical protein